MPSNDWRAKLAGAARALLGVSAYTPSKLPHVIDLDDPMVKRARRAMGGQLQPLPQGQTRWFLADVETARQQADAGRLQQAARLARAVRTDGMIAGLLHTRTSGLVALPKKFRGGSTDMQKALEARGQARPVFDEMFPAPELAKLAADGILLGVGVAELVPVEGREHPVMVRLDPEFLTYRWNEDRWYFRSIAAEIPITPGDGRWILHTPGGRMQPWNAGLWEALGQAYVHKTHAKLNRANYAAKLANPARVAQSPAGATDELRQGFMSRLMAWGINTVFELPPGWEAKLLESNGRGWDVFGREIETADLEAMISLAGQVVTVTGGSGFANAEIHKTIRADLIQETADGLAYTLDTQGIPAWVARRYGVDALKNSPQVSWDTAPPEDLTASAQSMSAAADAINKLTDALSAVELRPDIKELAARFGVPTENAPKTDAPKRVRIELAPTDIAKVVRVDEARASQGLGPIGDDRGKLTIQELEQGGSVDDKSEQDDSVTVPAPPPEPPAVGDSADDS